MFFFDFIYINIIFVKIFVFLVEDGKLVFLEFFFEVVWVSIFDLDLVDIERWYRFGFDLIVINKVVVVFMVGG